MVTNTTVYGNLVQIQTAANVTIGTAEPPPVREQIVEGDIPQQPRAFQLREDLLERLHERISRTGAAVVDAVTGTPGVGKTMLAASYAWTCQQAGWPLVAWITAQTEDQIVTGLAALARRLNLPDPDEDARTSATKARAWLAASAQPGLLVFDNATDLDTVRPWCPATGATRIVITTRNRAFHTLFHPVEVSVFTPDQAITFLHQRTGRTDPGAENVAEELGYLPLALGQAAALIARRHLSYPAYLTLLRDFPLHEHLPESGDGYPAGTAEAILLSLTQAEDTIPGAGQLLELLAVLSPAGVPRPILYGTMTPDPAQTSDLDRLLADLADTSLITFSEDGTTIGIHRLIQRVLRERARHTPQPDTETSDQHDNRLPDIVADAIALLARFNYEIPHGAATWAARPAVEMLLEQTTALHTLTTTELDEPSAYLLGLRTWCAHYLTNLADLPRAIPLYEQILGERERLLGGDHPDTLSSRNSLAYAYWEAGDLGRAIPLYEQTLAERERLLGGDHPDTLGSRNNLAYAYRTAGDLGRAISLFEQTLAEMERVLGDDHPSTLTSRNNLASAYRAAGDLGRAISLFEQTLAEMERVLGDDHPSTLTSRNNLASAYRAAGDLGRAISLFEQTLAEMERVLGDDHPSTLTSRNNLASAYEAAGDLGRAISLFEQTLAEMERVLGDDHPSTLTSRNNLAHAYRTTGDLGRAISLFEQTLAEQERVLGGDHPDTLTSRYNLACAYRAAGDLGRAIPLYVQTLANCERVLGGDHPITKTVRKSLSTLGKPSR